MVLLDYLVLLTYFLVMILIGLYSSRRIQGQADFFMGGRSFGKLLQTFAAFGAGTGSSDPVNTARTVFTGGMSGMWSVMYWLLVTPFYWITAIWHRRMRHLTLGDWFVERYQSRALGAGYCVFGILFYMVYGSMLFSAIGKVASPLLGVTTFSLAGQSYPIELILVPTIGLVVLLYGVMGGLHAAYYTDLVQGMCIILLSVILIPYGLHALVVKFGDPANEGLMAGFTYIHQQLPAEHFHMVGSTSSSEFPLHRIIAVVIINLIGIVVQPHFIATGGGSAKTEQTARVGLVSGNFLKRFCTVGWVLTALIALALYADHPELMLDPDKTWGIASRELLGPGLRGLMLACLLAALMSSVDAYMVVGSGLVVRNFYAPYINPTASEAQYLKVARITGTIVVAGAVIVSLFYMNVFQQLQLTWVFNILFAAPFWIGLYWRRATLTAAWVTVAYSALLFFVIPTLGPWAVPALRTDPRWTAMNPIVETVTVHAASPSDVLRRSATIAAWQSAADAIAAQGQSPEEQFEALEKLGARPSELTVGDPVSVTQRTGGQGIYWPDGLEPIDAQGQPAPHIRPEPLGQPQLVSDSVTQTWLSYPPGTRFRGKGSLRLDFLLYEWLGVELASKSTAVLNTLELPPKIITPFLVMILVSWMTRRPPESVLNRYYTKMKTPVDPDPEVDRHNLEVAYANPASLEHRKLFPGTNLEFQKPTATDLWGVAVSFGVCALIIGLAMLVARIGA
ncbi:MAG: sodium:solute symporter family protein [Pirellulaceae bacterium]|nr:sodium:solute symporter family protein [Pirellulaceae bacterium]